MLTTSGHLRLAAPSLAVIALVGCGGSGSSHSTGSTARTRSASPSQRGGQPVVVNKSVVQSGPGGAKVKVTLVSYQPSVSEPTNDALTTKVFAVTLRLQNLSSKSVRAHPPTYYSVLRLANTAGAGTVAHAKGSCSGAFYQTRINLAAHSAAQGCIPYAYGNSRPVTFGFGFGLRTANWRVTTG